MVDLISGGPSPKSSPVDGTIASEWTPDFVRGIATACPGFEEIAFNSVSRVISFRNSDMVRINV